MEKIVASPTRARVTPTLNEQGYQEFKRRYKLESHLAADQIAWLDQYVSTRLPTAKWRRNAGLEDPGIYDTVDYFLSSGLIKRKIFFQFLYACCYDRVNGNKENKEWVKQGQALMAALRKDVKKLVVVYRLVYEENKVRIQCERGSSGMTKHLTGLSPAEYRVFYKLFTRYVERHVNHVDPLESRRKINYPLNYYLPGSGMVLPLDFAKGSNPELSFAPFFIKCMRVASGGRVTNELRIRLGHFAVFWGLMKLKDSYFDTGEYLRTVYREHRKRFAKVSKTGWESYALTKFSKPIYDWKSGRITLPSRDFIRLK